MLLIVYGRIGMPSLGDPANRSKHLLSFKRAFQFGASCGRAIYDTKDGLPGSALLLRKLKNEIF
jgi:hypothetical protein